MPSTGRLGLRHPRVQRLRRLAQRRRFRDEERAFVIDGPILLEEALESGMTLQDVFAEPGSDGALLQRCASSGAAVHQVHEGVLAKATDTVTPQPLAAIAAFHDVSLETVSLGPGDPARSPGLLGLVLVGVSDPGNLGTLLRSARAVGAELVVCCDGTVDPYNPKSVRASAGALFTSNLVREASSRDAISGLQGGLVRCLGAVARGGTDYDQVDLTGRLAIVLGNEAHGLPADVESRLDELVSIPMAGPVESLNVGMAGTVMCFEALRQRRVTKAAATSE